jgi:hypothetical protein
VDEPAEGNAQQGQNRQDNRDVEEQQPQSETVRLFSKGDDLLPSVPCERNPDGEVVHAEPGRDGSNESRSRDSH